ncbi:hypothetical protein SAMN04487765_2024 [Tenacibaculum sp. MAR_2010_89]|uniref:hypothetical protein n=1 Tax=Tenacibaculum sp. MAR_2010_89 TaxID=1250198 RepID=UPI0008941EE9|nr:hypothetical protein [Tenacibaculum sp. MAR_2010_89]SEE29010.1 hypothetical protein SAMN04487765_2024 [Tenacibaculum sp. MAR_2010_89]
MKFFNKNNNPEHENRLRLQKLVDNAEKSDIPNGWKKETFAIGGLSEVGFSKNYPELLLVISSQGRGIIDCSKLELTDRNDNTDFDWFNSYELWSMGIGKLANEKISIGGLCGGGLPLLNQFGDGIQYMATEWPIIDLIFEPNFKSIYKEEDGKDCFRIFHDYEIRAYGFSYNGEYFITATSSEINVYRKEKTV